MRIQYSFFRALKNKAFMLPLLVFILLSTVASAQTVFNSGGDVAVTTCGAGSSGQLTFSSFVSGSPPPQFCTQMPNITHTWYTTETGSTTVTPTILDPLCSPSDNWNTIFQTGITVTSNISYWVQVTVNGVLSGARHQVTATFTQGTSISAGISLNLEPTQPQCGGDLIITATGGTVLRWYKNGNIIPDATAQTYVPMESGAYKVEVTLNKSQCGGSPFSPEVQVTIVPKTNVSLSITSVSSSTVCSGTPVDFRASNNLSSASYSWSTGETTQSITRTITDHTILSVTITTTQACVNTATATANTTWDIYPIPSTTGSMADKTYCSNEAGTELVVGGYPIANVGMNYTIYKNGVEELTLPATQANFLSFGNNYTAGTYSVKVSNPTCPNAKVSVDDNVSVMQAQLQTLNPAITVLNPVDVTLQGGQPVYKFCQGSQIQVQLTGGGTPQWPQIGTVDSSNPNIFYPNIDVGASATFTATVTTNAFCTAIGTQPPAVTIARDNTVVSLSITSDHPEDTVCPGTPVKFDATTNVSGASYTWSTGETGPSITNTINSLTNLSVTLTTTQHCVDVSTKTASNQKDIYPIPSAAGSMADQTYCSSEAGTELVVGGYPIANVGMNYTLYKNGVEGITLPATQANFLSFGNNYTAGTYSVKVSSPTCPNIKVPVDDNVVVSMVTLQSLNPSVTVLNPAEVVLDSGQPVYKYCPTSPIAVQIVGFGNGTVQWPQVGTIDSSDPTKFYPSIDVGASLTFTVTVQGGFCATVATQPQPVTIARQTQTPLSTDMIKFLDNCGREDVILFEPPGVSMFWQPANDLSLKETFFVPPGNTDKTTLSITTPQTLYLRSRQGQCWSDDILPVDVQIQSNPVVTINPIKTNVCPGESGIVGVTVGDGVTITWFDDTGKFLSNDAIYTTPQLVNTTAIHLEASTPLGCKTTQDVTFTVITETHIPEEPIVTKVSNTTYQLTLSNPSNGYTYYWQVSPSDTKADDSSNPKTVTTPGVYFIKSRNNATSCWGDFSGVEVIDVQPHTGKTLSKMNLVRSFTYLVDHDIDENDAHDVTVETSYLDGLGRPMQKVVKQGSINLQDLVVPAEYDNLGREVRSYLPYESSSADGKFKTTPYNDQYQFYTGTSKQVARSSYPFSHKQLENSVAATAHAVSPPGETWAGMAGTVDERSTKAELASNTASEVLKWTYTYPTPTYPRGIISARNGSNLIYYEAGVLSKVVTTDENRNKVIQFSDKLGHLILKRVQANTAGTEWADTYYIYDDFGNLMVALPPEGVKQMLSQQ